MKDIGALLSGQKATIEHILSIAHAPGLSLGVVQHGKVVHEAHFGYRDVESKIPPDSETRYNINSLTKAILAVACSVLIEEGKLEWDTRLSRFFPEFARDGIETWITIEDLLSHRSGFDSPTSFWLQDHNIVLLEKYDALPVYLQYGQNAHSRFRSSWIYNNYSYSIVGLLIEKVSGQRLGDFLTDRVFKPLGMTRTTTEQLTTDPGQNNAKSYASLQDQSLFEIPLVEHTGRDTAMEGAGGVKSCLRDMLPFYAKMLEEMAPDAPSDSSPLRDSKQLVKPRSFFDASGMQEETYALGWIRTHLPSQLGKQGTNRPLVKDLPVVGEGGSPRLCIYHQGYQSGSCTSVYMFPADSIAIVALQNSAAPCDCASWIAQLCVQTIFAHAGQIDFVALTKESSKTYMSTQANLIQELRSRQIPGTNPSLAREKYVGRYYDRSGKFFIEIRTGDMEALELRFQGLESQRHALSHYQYDTFSWIMSHDEASRKARLLVYVELEYYLLSFRLSSDRREVTGLWWKIETDAEGEPSLFIKER